MPEEPGSKNHVSIYLHEVHLRLLDGLIPFYGGTRAEVIRFIIVDWLSKNADPAQLKRKRVQK
jgi:hypothetical protein